MKQLIICAIFLISIFQLQAQVADSSLREVKLQGAVNFRDLGGYKNKDSKKVKTGLLYRSAALNTLTDADIAKIASFYGLEGSIEQMVQQFS